MIVFRIETETGGGPYRGEDRDVSLSAYIREKSWNRGDACDCHPMPYDDGCGDFGYDHRFGFKSYKQLHDWFFAPLKMIEDTGFFIAVYEDVKDFYKGDHQVAFVPTEKVTRLKPTEAYKLIRKNKEWNTATRLQ